jgi:hypothetical protein
VYLDYKARVLQAKEEQSILYMMFNGLVMDNFDYYKEIVHMVKGCFEKSSRMLTISLGYDLNMKGNPRISIILPNEESSLGTVGVTSEYEIVQISEEESIGYDINKAGNRSTYILLLTSDNPNEVILLYHLLKNSFLSAIDQFSFRGLQNVVISGRDLTMEMETPPPNYLFHRSVGLSFEYYNKVRTFFEDSEIDDIILESSEPIE